MITPKKIHHTESLAKQVDALFCAWNKTDEPGCAIGIVQDGQLLYGRGYGLANIEHGIPLSTQSVFDIASDSKKFVALCTLLLARQGKLSLEDEVQTHLPYIRRYEQPITLRQLIHHTSGLRDYITVGYLAGMSIDGHYPDEEWLNLIARQQELNFVPGTEHFYSNTGYVLLAKVIECVSGMSLRAFTDQHIFAPLDMKNTHFHDDYKEVVPNRAVGYCPKDGGGFEMWVTSCNLMGARGIVTTVEDLCRWDANFCNNVLGGYGNDLIAEMITPGKLSTGELLDYAFAYENHCYRGFKVIEHGGSAPGFRSQMVCFPEQHFTVICIFNRGDGNPTKLCRQVADLYLGAEFTPTIDGDAASITPSFIDLPVSDIESKVGFYHDANGGRIWEMTMQDGSLMVKAYEWGVSFKIAAMTLQRFKAVDFFVDVVVDFITPESGLPVELRASENGKKPDVLKRMATSPVTTDQLKNYCGNYESDELGVMYRLSFEDDKIVFRAKGLDKADLLSINQTFFVCPGCGLFEFTFDQQGQVIGMIVSTGRVRGISFVKVPCE